MTDVARKGVEPMTDVTRKAEPEPPETVAMPAPTAWPMLLGLGITLLAAGVLTNLALSVVGLLLTVLSLGGWIDQLLPGRGEMEEALRPHSERARAVEGKIGA